MLDGALTDYSVPFCPQLDAYLCEHRIGTEHRARVMDIIRGIVRPDPGIMHGMGTLPPGINIRRVIADATGRRVQAVAYISPESDELLSVLTRSGSEAWEPRLEQRFNLRARADCSKIGDLLGNAGHVLQQRLRENRKISANLERLWREYEAILTAYVVLLLGGPKAADERMTLMPLIGLLPFALPLADTPERPEHWNLMIAA